MTPLVSVVMPVRDGERFLREAVESVLGQTLSDLELVVVDDGSTDATPDILAGYARADERVVVSRTAGVGQADARNAAVSLARADLVGLLDADDVAHPDRLERQRDFMDANEEVALVGGAATFVDEAGRVIAADVRYPLTDEEIRRAFDHTTPVLNSAALVRRGVFEEVGGYRSLFDDSEDLDLWLRIAGRYQLANLAETVVRYRVHTASASVQRLERQSLTALAARMSDRARRDGLPDLVERLDSVDRETLLGLGATEEQIAKTFVVNATWLAKMLHAAGDTDAAASLLRAAEAHEARLGSRTWRARIRSRLPRSSSPRAR
ncbi:MAG TPA: glycosyltransferase [Gaiellaceae bacterium]|nr:glycosyltransferase [Gaiellaceae bacterium]